jgi:hypothetical protein
VVSGQWSVVSGLVIDDQHPTFKNQKPKTKNKKQKTKNKKLKTGY